VHDYQCQLVVVYSLFILKKMAAFEESQVANLSADVWKSKMPDFFESVIDILLKFGKLNPVEFYPKRTSTTDEEIDKQTVDIQKIHPQLASSKEIISASWSLRCLFSRK